MHQFFMYLDFVPIMEARQQNYSLEAVLFPHMKDHDRRSVTLRYDRLLQEGKQIITSQKDIDDVWNSLRKGRGK